MQIFIELWKAKDAWHQLSAAERGDYLGQIGPAIQSLLDNGMEIVNWGTNDTTTDRRADYDFFSIMKFPNAAQIRDFEKLVAGAGWYDYFDQVNISGEGTNPEEVIGQLIAL